MATNRTRVTRTRKAGTGIDNQISDFLFFGPIVETPRNTPAWSLRCSRFFHEPEIRDFWAVNADELKKQWKREGRKGKPWIIQYLQEEDER